MSYFMLLNRRMPKQSVSGFRFQQETENSKPYISLRIRGKEEIVPLSEKQNIKEIKDYLVNTFSDFIQVGGWYLRKTVFREYKPVEMPGETACYILFKTSLLGNLKIRFKDKEDMDKELLSLDQLFNVE